MFVRSVQTMTLADFPPPGQGYTSASAPPAALRQWLGRTTPIVLRC